MSVMRYNSRLVNCKPNITYHWLLLTNKTRLTQILHVKINTRFDILGTIFPNLTENEESNNLMIAINFLELSDNSKEEL